MTGQSEASRLVELFSMLARIPSPSGNEGACGEAVTGELEALGLAVRRDGAGAALESDGDNLYCRIAPTVPGLPIFFCAHLDTVPPTKPLHPVLVDGVLRNADPSIIGADNKAAIAVLLDAVRTIAADEIPHAGIELVFTIGEEQGLRGARAFDLTTLEARSGFVLDHTGAIGAYVAAAPSRFIVRAAMHGRAAHAAIAPEDGTNAIIPLARALSSLPPASRDVSVNVGLVSGGSALNVVPEHAEAWIDVRSTEHEAGRSVVDAITGILRESADASGCTLELEVSNPYLAYRLPPDSVALGLAAVAFARCELVTTALETRGGSDANVFRAHGYDCVNLAHAVVDFHGPDEHVAVTDLVLMERVVLEIVAAARSRG